MSGRAVSVNVNKTCIIIYRCRPFHRTCSHLLKATASESAMARFQIPARLFGLALVALQAALAAESPDITHQSPEHAPPVPYLSIQALFTNSQIDSRNAFVESNLSSNTLEKRQREEDGNGGLLCKKAPCPDGRSVITLHSAYKARSSWKIKIC